MRETPHSAFRIPHFVLLMLLCLPRATYAQTKPEPSDSEDLLYLAKDRLIILRIHVRVDGKSFATVWHEFVDQLLKEFDKDKDGVLSSQEATQLPKRNQLVQAGIVARTSSNVSTQADRNRDGKVTRDELAKYIRGMGLTPFSAQIGNQQTRRQVVFQGGMRQRGAQGAELFGLLDANEDGKLSRDEFAAASRTLHKSDLDDDETISIAELQPIQNPFIARPARNSSNTNQQPSFTTLSAVGSPSKLANQLLTRYDRAESPKPGSNAKAEKDQNLSRKELGLEQDSFQQFDADGNGLLDYTELMRFVRKPAAAVEVVIRLGKRKYKEKMAEVVRSSKELKAGIRSSSTGLVTVMLGKTQIEIGANQYVWGVNQSALYKSQFKAADTDNNAYLEMKEVERNAYFRNTFQLMDRDGDGKVFEEEMLAFIKQIAAAAQARTILSVGNAGRNLFEILDLNRDRRLGRRELLAAVERMELWDADSDKHVAESELPTHFRLTLGRGQPGFPGAPIRAFASPGSGRPAGSTRIGPLWFQKMDRNRDGDVSRREFIGSRKKFDKYDTNKDGLIDATEATAAN